MDTAAAFAFKGEKVHIPEVAEKLNVTHILEGSVRKASNRARITAQLIDAHSDTHLWSETYDREEYRYRLPLQALFQGLFLHWQKEPVPTNIVNGLCYQQNDQAVALARTSFIDVEC